MSIKVLASDGKTTYTVGFSEKQGRFTCTCPDFKFRQGKIPNGKCKHIEKLHEVKPPDERYKPRVFFLQAVEILQEMLKGFQFEICGSWRRQRPFLKDIDVLILTRNSEDLVELESLAGLTGQRDYGGNSRITYWFGPVQVDFRTVTDPNHWGSMLCHFTGSKEENIRLRRKALSMGMSLSEYGLKKDGVIVASEKEEDIYRTLGESWREPWERDPS